LALKSFGRGGKIGKRRGTAAEKAQSRVGFFGGKGTKSGDQDRAKNKGAKKGNKRGEDGGVKGGQSRRKKQSNSCKTIQRFSREPWNLAGKTEANSKSARGGG